MDHLISLPSHLSFEQLYVYQFEAGHSNDRCVEAVLAMIAQLAYPGRYPNSKELMHDLYQKYVGPDVPGDTQGTTKEQALDWLHSQNIGHIDMQSLIGGSEEPLHVELQAQNRQNVFQLLIVRDMAHLHYAMNGEKLYGWQLKPGVGHCILRVGYSDNEGYSYYLDPAAGLGFPHPVPIAWSDVVAAGIEACIACMPRGVLTPPAGFSFEHGTWPIPPAPKPVLDVTKAESTINAMIQAMDALKAAMGNLANDISVLKAEV